MLHTCVEENGYILKCNHKQKNEPMHHLDVKGHEDKGMMMFLKMKCE